MKGRGSAAAYWLCLVVEFPECRKRFILNWNQKMCSNTCTPVNYLGQLRLKFGAYDIVMRALNLGCEDNNTPRPQLTLGYLHIMISLPAEM